MTHIDYSVFNFKYWLGPDHFVEKSTLACDLALVSMDEDKEKLADLFIKIDRVGGTQKILDVNPGFPVSMTLVQFLQICEGKGLKFKDFCTDDINLELEKHEEVLGKLRENREKKAELKAKEKERGVKEIEKQGIVYSEQVLLKEKKYYQEKIRQNKSERYSFVLERINEELQNLQKIKKTLN